MLYNGQLVLTRVLNLVRLLRGGATRLRGAGDPPPVAAPGEAARGEGGRRGLTRRAAAIIVSTMVHMDATFSRDEKRAS